MRKTRESEFQKGILNHSKRRRSSSALGGGKESKPKTKFFVYRNRWISWCFLSNTRMKKKKS